MHHPLTASYVAEVNFLIIKNLQKVMCLEFSWFSRHSFVTVSLVSIVQTLDKSKIMCVWPTTDDVWRKQIDLFYIPAHGHSVEESSKFLSE